IVDNPRGGMYYGGQVAGPVFAEMASAIIRRRGIAPDAEASPVRAAAAPAAHGGGPEVDVSVRAAESGERQP
ncbi:MAG: penicillin-binding protein 2, partial [Fimbriimonadaceae bacterium]